MKKLILSPHSLDNNEGGGGLEIEVLGYKGDIEGDHQTNVFLEIYEGKLRVHVWNGNQDPITTECSPSKPTTPSKTL